MTKDIGLAMKMQAKIWADTVKWNQAISLIKEINIEMYHQKDYREIVDEIVKEVFNESE